MEKLSEEFDAVGFYLSGHPLDQYEQALHKLHVKRYTEFEAMTERGATSGALAGIVISARERRSQKGNKFAFAMFSDATGQFEAVIFSDTLAVAGNLLAPGTPVKLGVAAERDGDTLKLRVESIQALDEAVASVQGGIKLMLDRRVIEKNPAAIAQLKSKLKPGKGEIRFGIELPDFNKELVIAVPGRYDVSPATAGMLSTLPGVLEISEL